MEEKLLWPEGRQTFSEIIEENFIYVDKTAYLASMIEGAPKSWFFARPRRFGKSLAVSTLKAIFSGKKELFKGLAIEKRLGEKKFAPRPTIHLDMSSVAATLGLENFERALRIHTVSTAKDHGIDLPLDYPSPSLISELIKGCSRKYNDRVAVLIDEYDSPVAKLFETPEMANKVRASLREYYGQLKATDEHISFVFVTGITKFVQGGLYSAFNNPTDISLMPEYGVLAGFTHEEIELYFSRQVENVAKHKNMPKSKLLGEMKRYYNGFCFDGQHFVYCPFSTLRFFTAKEFDNFWFNTGTPEQLVSFFNENRFTVDEFRGASVERDMIVNPSRERFQDPHVYLFQLGYLSLRPSQAPNRLKLDYPNAEVLLSMSLRLLESYFHSALAAKSVRDNVNIAASARDPAALVAELNRLLSNIAYNDYGEASLSESFYRGHFSTLLYAMGVDAYAELHGNKGRSDLVFKLAGQAWVLEMKLNKKASGDAAMAKEAIKQILEKNYGGRYANPVLLGLVVNAKDRLIKAWECRGGLSERPERKIREHRGRDLLGSRLKKGSANN
jgi:hypothetical protein